MFFRRKGRLNKTIENNLWELITNLKDEWMRNKTLVEKAVEPSEELLYYYKLAEVKYFYMVREAKIRQK
ncbi:YaaL family protein [Bacillus sp. Marseille-P3661]|uniref:YaaL family protein n=1 Tax=Bacillus sp. Marseille-P3661 TaxID=1936234 RepID=UPI000C82CC79|nr:YaaL family protein [Bacillus sp. Marseille-P3661]